MKLTVVLSVLIGILVLACSSSETVPNVPSTDAPVAKSQATTAPPSTSAPTAAQITSPTVVATTSPTVASTATSEPTVAPTLVPPAETTRNNYGLSDIERIGFQDYSETSVSEGTYTANGWEGEIIPPGERGDTDSMAQFVEVYVIESPMSAAVKEELTSSINVWTQQPMQTLFIGNLMFYCFSDSVCEHIINNMK